MVNPMGDFERVEQKMAQLEQFVHARKELSNVNETNLVTGKLNHCFKESGKK